jgi:hypothetical protein
MKFIINVLFPLYLFTGYTCYAQKKTGALIPLVKHSYKIDNLLLGIANMGSSVVPKGSFFSIKVEKNDSVTFLSINSFDKMEINNIMVTAHLRNEYLGYFTLKEYLVFVNSSKRFDGLFSETKSLKRFNFINFSHKIEVPDSSSVPVIRYLADFIYQNGKFSPMYGGR